MANQAPMGKAVSFTLHYRETNGSVKAVLVTANNRRSALNYGLNWCVSHNVQFLALWGEVLPINHTQEIEPF